MRWIFENIQVLIAVAGAIAYWLTKMRKKSEEPPPVHEEKTFDDPALAERTRRIREEIQRKIEQRARGRQDEPVAERVEVPEPPPLPRAVERPSLATISRAEARRQAEILEEQATIQERLREAEAMRAAVVQRTAFEIATADRVTESKVRMRKTLLVDVRDPAALRRAFLMKEILGAPVSLRD